MIRGNVLGFSITVIMFAITVYFYFGYPDLFQSRCDTKLRGASNCKLEIDPIFDNLRVGHRDEQFRLLLRKGVYSCKYMNSWEKFEENHLPNWIVLQ